MSELTYNADQSKEGSYTRYTLTIRTSTELIMFGLGIRDIVVELHEQLVTYSKVPLEFWELEKRWPCFVNSLVGTKCQGPKLITQDAPVEFIMTRNPLLRSTILFQLYKLIISFLHPDPNNCT